MSVPAATSQTARYSSSRATTPAVQFQNVSKSFPVRRGWRAALRSPRNVQYARVVQSVSLEIPEGEFFGLDRLLDLVTRQEAARLSAPETLRRLINAVLEHQQDMLQDDATVLLLEWAGDPRALLPAEMQ